MAERSTTKKPEAKPAVKAAPHWETLADACSTKQGWTKHTRRMAVPGGTLYQTTTEHRSSGAGGSRILACSEALVFVPTHR